MSAAASADTPSGPSLDLLREAGRRVTPQRQLVLEALCASVTRHLTADEVWQEVRARYRGFNRSTVYRVLDFLVDAGLVVEHVIGAVAHYELASDVHHHLVCRHCRAIFNMEKSDLQALVAAARSRHGFVVGSLGATIEGECAACAKERAAASTRRASARSAV